MPHIRNRHEFGSFLKAFRFNHRLTQKELSDKLGVKQSSISSYERGAHEPSDLTYQNMVALVGEDAYFDMPSKNQMRTTLSPRGTQLFVGNRTKQEPAHRSETPVQEEPQTSLAGLFTKISAIKDLMAKRKVLAEQIELIDTQLEEFLS